MKIIILILIIMITGCNYDMEEKTMCYIGDSITASLYVDNNYGIPGASTWTVLQNIDNIEYYDIAIIMIGINDLANGGENDLDKIVYRLNLILNRLYADKIYVISVLPNDLSLHDWNVPRTYTNEDIKKLNDLYKNNLTQNSIFLDLYDIFELNGKLNNEYTIDGIHLSEIGKSILLDEYRKNIF